MVRWWHLSIISSTVNIYFLFLLLLHYMNKDKYKTFLLGMGQMPEGQELPIVYSDFNERHWQFLLGKENIISFI